MSDAGVNSRQAVVLRLLLTGPDYAVNLRRRMLGREPGLFTRPAPHLELHLLEEDGYVSSRETDPLPCRNDRPRRYYALTEKGETLARALTLKAKYRVWNVTLALGMLTLLLLAMALGYLTR